MSIGYMPVNYLETPTKKIICRKLHRGEGCGSCPYSEYNNGYDTDRNGYRGGDDGCMIKCFFSGQELPDNTIDCYIFGKGTPFIKCLNCKWYKTREQFLNDQRNAELKLHQRGIKSIIKYREDGEKIVTTEKIRR